MLLLVNDVYKTISEKFESLRVQSVICIRVTVLHYCYMRMNLFSANQTRVVFQVHY